MLARLAARGVKVDLTVEPGMPPQGPLIPGEQANGLTPDYRDVPTEPYRSSPGRFPGPDPATPSDPLLIPMSSGRRLKGLLVSTITLGSDPSVFALRLIGKLRRRPPRVLAFALRPDARTIGAWESIVKNLTHLAEQRGMRFVTASEAVASLVPVAGPPRREL
jgi:hypothetical protein